MGTIEKQSPTPEQHVNTEALDALGKEQREVLRHKLDAAEAAHHEKQAEDAETIHREAVEAAKNNKVATTIHEKSPARRRGTALFTKRQREASFKRHMDVIQEEMKPTERMFSKLIHKNSVERTSDALGVSVFRPNAMLTGSICAFILVTILYVMARYYGYRLSGFETIGAFVLGWILGVIYDYLRVMISGKK